MISLVRIDDRLIHGQVVEAWVPALGIERVVVVCDHASADEMQAALMRMALPERVELEIVPVARGAAAVRRAAEDRRRTLVLAPGPAEVLALVEAGVSVATVNVGGMHHAAGRVQLGKAIFIGKADAKALESLSSRGVRLEGRAVPSESPADVAALVRGARA